MCGIVGCILGDDAAIIAVMRSLGRLQNRGYDSAGICTIKDNYLMIKKYVSSQNTNAIQYLNNDPITKIRSNIAIGHTRWATHGTRTVENAHPHHDLGPQEQTWNARFAIVHNGIIENYKILREELINNGYTFYGETDTEVIAKYINYLTKTGRDFRALNTKMEGTWAILILDRITPNTIYFMKNGSPLIIGFDKTKSKIMLVSELGGFDEDIEYYYILSDYDYGSISMDDSHFYHKKNNLELHFKIETQKHYEIHKIPSMSYQLTPHPYPHWTIKEINDQPEAIDNLTKDRIINGDVIFPELEKYREDMINAEHFILLACGTSYHAAQIGAKIFKEFGTDKTLEIIDGADFEKSDIPIHRRTVLILLSQSGETRDLYCALLVGKKLGIRSIGIVNVENSLIAREVDVCLHLKAGRENAVASTKSFTNQVVMLVLLAIWLNPDLVSLKEKYLSSLKTLPHEFRQIIQQTEKEIPFITYLFRNKSDCFILGKHQCEWIAKEGSLKIKEITYIHAEGYSAAALKHGPFALLSNRTPVILIANNDKFYPKMENITAEIKSRHATVIYITNRRNVPLDHIDHLFYFESDSVLFPLISIVPLQIMAYHLALIRGNHPDYPRNLAKVVTVE
ncbi:MAG: glutamine--fructose-6-phosphate transaminase (isomerizing) [Nitrososphaerota archaeon]